MEVGMSDDDNFKLILMIVFAIMFVLLLVITKTDVISELNEPVPMWLWLIS